ncbi:MAG TPA: DUF882 domain-containing protein [Desulfuromonadales bacterium]|nr:DUF882 domain-containing protein [Desulfuromonadales bacterium]
MGSRQDRTFSNEYISRRYCLKLGLWGAVGTLLPMQTLAGVPETSADERILSFYNTHTGEHLNKARFWAEGRFIPETLREINHLLRDHRTDSVYPIDPALLTFLYSLKRQLPSYSQFHVISGYRSPETNQMLNRRSNGEVSTSSLHMEGKAIDLRVPGCDLSKLRKTALAMKRGGVGYYPSSNFVHIDSGRPRWWSGS